ncbi:MAG: ribosome-associated translation inhibitor RaiA [Acidimicrobiaceae bacterium]|nr:ribosome-associated translation inhibitor RaiA [Acidimicrobiaceae bacterium]
MDIVIKGRNVEVPEHYRVHVGAKLARLERYDRKTIRADVELFHEPNPRQAKNCQRVEITLTGKGSPVRAEASAGDFYAALDCAMSKVENRLRRMHDRRRVHHGRRQPTSVAEATSPGSAQATTAAATGTAVLEAPRESAPLAEVPEPRLSDDRQGPGRIVREKEHSSQPMTVDQALSEMELVGHDFYLFVDESTRCPSVVYRRRGFDYGVIRLAG